MSSRTPRLYSIPPGAPFLPALASGVMRKADQSSLPLSACEIYLPTRRAARGLREAFLDLNDGAPMLLPRMTPLGDVDSDELILSGGPAATDLDIPPAIDPMQRQALLAQLIARKSDYSPAHTARLAGALAGLIDSVQTEELNWTALDDLAPAELATHWQEVLEFLDIVTDAWPEILKERGQIDPMERRIRLLSAQAALWEAQPPNHPVIAAGSTGSVPAVARLMHRIARLPHGCVVLPGLDRALDAESWDALPPTHPQFGLRQLLKTLQARPAEVDPWPEAEADDKRSALWRTTLFPAARADQAPSVPKDAAQHLRLLTADNPPQEATAIALAMREVLERPGKTANLITPDRNLARRVAGELARWGVTVDDSAGIPLGNSRAGIFAQLVADLAANDGAPVTLLSVLKHPLAGFGLAPADARRLARRLDQHILRGPRPGSGLAVWRAKAKHQNDEDLAIALDQLETLLAPLAELSGSTQTVDTWAQAHMQVLEAFAANDGESGAERLWRDEEGDALAGFFESLAQAGGGFPPIRLADYPGLLSALMLGRTVRPRYRAHPRLQILGPLEARLLHADRTILAGLNEGIWPQEPNPDPWMSRPMKERFGLPPAERRVGLSAHDFVQAACGDDVILSRAEKQDGAPTLPARWLLRLETVLGVPPLAAPYAQWAETLDTAEDVENTGMPAPTPRVNLRPTNLSVTDVETWRKNPYALFAKHILGLQPLDPIDAAPGAAERGNFIHEALHLFLSAPETGSDDAMARLLAFGRQAYTAFIGAPEDTPSLFAFWWPRFAQNAVWFLEQQVGRASAVAATETRAEHQFSVDGQRFTLRARADRVDRLDGGFEIIDYKTGKTASAREVIAGYKPQLPLEAWLLQESGFEGLSGTVTELSYWKLTGKPDGNAIERFSTKRDLKDIPLQDLIAASANGLKAMIQAFADPSTPYLPHPNPLEKGWGDYDHLARVREWNVVGDQS